jgi:hypothetical protein
VRELAAQCLSADVHAELAQCAHLLESLHLTDAPPEEWDLPLGERRALRVVARLPAASQMGDVKPLLRAARPATAERAPFRGRARLGLWPAG